VSGLKLGTLFDRWLRATAELPLDELLATVGVEMEVRPAESASDRGGRPASRPAKVLASRVALGARTAGDGNDVRLTHVLHGGAALAAGLAAGDVIVAMDGIRVTPKTLEGRLAQLKPGDRARLHVFRRDELHEIGVTFAAAPADTCVLRFDKRAPARAAALRRNWIGR
jgi:predicted metalloprotease with PDZ domain